VPSDAACILCWVKRLRRRASGSLGRRPRKSALPQLLYLGHKRDGTHSKGGTALPTIVFRAMRQNGPHHGLSLFCNSMTELGRWCGRSRTRPACANLRRPRLGPTSLGQHGPQRDSFLARNVHGFLDSRPSPKGEQLYDIRDDQALPNLQTAINQESADRRRTMRLRQACLAGVVACAHNTPFGLSFRFVQVTSGDKTLSQTQTQE
jgi:hypothetical protein